MCTVTTFPLNEQSSQASTRYSPATYTLLEAYWADYSSLWLAISDNRNLSLTYQVRCENGHIIALPLSAALDSLERHNTILCDDCQFRADTDKYFYPSLAA